ncbi:MAG TPA: MFS transporter [Actinocrinis sp.]|jgi:EmrB/QacA subfamily drug resistance transporter|nr:MFS transporter [Actinocrinis sp.]HEV3171510.1 MFS transporter [Actinocrinis sp.]
MSAMEQAARPVQVRYGEPAGRWVLFATVLGSAMTFVDATVVNVALPHLGHDLHANAAALQWTVNGYTLSLASLILLGGSLGDRFGRRRIFLIGVIWFAAASLLCGLAPTVGVLIAARVVQGVGGALLTPGSLAILEASFHPNDRGRAIGAWSGLGGIAGALGPFLGGWLVQVATWRLVFLINAPLAVLVVVAGSRYIPETRDPQAVRGFDVPGVVAAAAALAGLTYGFTAWPSRGGGSPQVVATLAFGFAALAAFVLVERRSAHPILPLEVFRSKAFSAANLVTFAVYAALGGTFFLVVLNLQIVAHYAPVVAGTAMLPVTFLMLLLSARSGALAGRIGPRIPMTVGPAVCAVAMLLLSRVGAHAPYPTSVLPGAIVLGLGLSLTVAPLTATALGALDERHAGIASGVNNAVARAAGLLAVAILPLAAGIGSGSLTDPRALAPAYHNAMLICAGLLVVGAITALLAVPSKLPSPVAEPEPEPEPPEGDETTPPQAVSTHSAPTPPTAPASTPVRIHCAIAGTPLHPRLRHDAPSS